MTSAKYIGMDVHKESISIAVMNSVGKVVMECVIETKASVILQFLNGLSGDLHVTRNGGQNRAVFSSPIPYPKGQLTTLAEFSSLGRRWNCVEFLRCKGKT